EKIFSITTRFPDSEKYGLTSQINRASVSVLSNIVEGNSKTSSKEKNRFLEISFSSLMEVLCQIDLSKDLSLIENNQYIDI
ncbi:MAG: four helix bundle protein, partial [Spirochaetes bacterium]|nr:four helix bundle protein [Spirochaetota bacterium]